MTLEDFFIRGGVSIGTAYFDDYVQVGEGFLKAYKLEEERAVAPRILTNETILQLVLESCRYYATKSCPQNSPFAIDADDQVFVNYLCGLFELFDAEDDRLFILNALSHHRKIIEKNLKKYANSPSIYRKYQWAALYHDFFVNKMLLICRKNI